MSGSTFGTMFKITTWGESHGKGIGVVVDGCPAGLSIDETFIQSYLNRRKPGQTKYATPRMEEDKVTILSGIFEGKTTGTPISLVVMNETARSLDYSEIANYYRPGHADFTFDLKYGFRDYRGGGRTSGRETIGRVAAGAIASALLKELGIEVFAYSKSIGSIQIDYANCKKENLQLSPLAMPDLIASSKAEDLLMEAMQSKDSVGGVIECIISGVPAGIGEPVFDKLDANLAKAIMSIGAVKGFEIGDGFAVASMRGSEDNDGFSYVNDKVEKTSNHAGGIMGGISDGSEIIFRAAIKATPSIMKPKNTITKLNENISVQVKGRHDPVIVPRAVVVVETMAALTILDMMMMNATSTVSKLKRAYEKEQSGQAHIISPPPQY